MLTSRPCGLKPRRAFFIATEWQVYYNIGMTQPLITSFFSNPEAGVLFARAAALDDISAAAAGEYYTVFIDASFLPHKAAIMEQMSAALKFPEYFGKNWDALADCLSDLPDWLEPGAKGYMIIITSAGLLAAAETGGLTALGAEVELFPPQTVREFKGSVRTLAEVLSESSATLYDISGKTLKTVFLF